MNVLEQHLYINFTKSTINCFEQFVNNVEKHEDLLSDAELIQTFRRLSKKMQIIASRWDYKMTKFNAISDDLPSCHNGHLKYDRTSDMITEEIHDFCMEDIDIKKESGIKTDSIICGFENVNEKLIVGYDGFFIEEFTPGIWKCNPCLISGMSLNNVLSHVNGKAHKKKINNKYLGL